MVRYHHHIPKLQLQYSFYLHHYHFTLYQIAVIRCKTCGLCKIFQY